MATPDVTVVIPTRDRAHLLPSALDSALRQEAVDLEVVVVDDGSEDETPALLESLDDPRLRVVRHPRCRGQSAARNSGIEVARGRWLAFLDDDDLWAPAKLRRQLEAARVLNATWVYCGALLVSPDGDVARMWGPPEPESVLRQLLRRNVVQAGASTVVAQAERVRAVGGFDEALGPLADRDLWIRLALDGQAAAVHDALVAYRRHAVTVIASSRTRALRDADVVASRYAREAREHGVEFDRVHLERWLDAELTRSLRAQAAQHLRARRRRAAVGAQARALVRSREAADARRLLAVLAGERGRALVRRHLRPPKAEAGSGNEPVPTWLAPYLRSAAP